MKTIRWVGGVALLAAAGITAILTTATAGDAIVRLRSGEQTLTGAQTSAYASWVLSVWPNSVPSHIAKLDCCRDRSCTVWWRPPLTSASDFLAAEEAGIIYRPKSIPAGQFMADNSGVRYALHYERRRLDWDEETNTPDPQGETAALAALNEGALGAAPAVQECVRIATTYDVDDIDEDGNVWDVIDRQIELSTIEAVTATERIECLRLQTCGARFGTVVE